MYKHLIRLKNRFSGLFDKESKVLFKNSSWVFLANSTGTVYAFLRSVIIARGLGAETLGHYTVAIAFALTIQEILKLNVGMGVIRYGAQFRSAERPDKMVALIKSAVIASMGSAALSVVIVGIMLLFFYDQFISVPGLSWFIFFYAIVNGLSFLDNISKGVLNLYYKFRVNSTVQIIMDTLEFLMIAGCIYFFSDNLQYFFAAIILTRLANTVICNTAALIEMRKELYPYRKSSTALIADQYNEIRTYILGNSFSNTLKTMMNQGDVLVLSAWAGPSAIGLYAVAKKLAYSTLTLTDPLVKSIFPQLSLLVFEKKFSALKTMLRKVTLFTALPAILILIPAILFRETLIQLVYGKQFIPAANTFIIHLLGALQGSVFFWTLPLVNSLGLTGLRFKIYVIATFSGLMVAWTTAASYGASGVAAGLLFANLLITALFLWYTFNFIRKYEKSSEGNLVTH